MSACCIIPTPELAELLSDRLKHRFKAAFPRAWAALHTARRNLREYSCWNQRICEVLKCPDNARIPRVTGAGRVRGGIQLMHNGLGVQAGSYYGWGGTRLLRKNHGCHEPQEEFAFLQVLKCLGPTPVMIECGAYWAFYSMWFCKEVPGGSAYLIEPDLENLNFGRRNFELNGLEGTFHRALVGAESGFQPDGSAVICVDHFVKDQKIQRVDILHADIQGSELGMLHGMQKCLADRVVSFLFISTHSEALHVSCQDFLVGRGYSPFISISPSQSFSVDGVLVACSEDYTNNIFQQPYKKAARQATA